MKEYAVILLMLAGIASHGQSSKQPLSRDSVNLALSYGAQAMELLEIRERQIENLKAEVSQVYGLADARELQVEVLTGVVEKAEARTFWQKLWSWIRGALVGAAVAVVALTI